MKGQVSEIGETRQHVRYRMKEGILAAMSVPGRLELTVGEVLDISEGGLAFTHCCEITPEPWKAEILLLGHEETSPFNLKIPAKLIYKRDFRDGYRSGFQFRNLTQDQKAMLAYFIESNMETAAA